MSSNTNIEWTDVTDNIIVVKGGGWWCRKISPGCLHCYAEKLNQNTFFKGNQMKYAGAAPEMVLREDVINGWAQQRLPKKHFVMSMSDVFGEWVTMPMAITFLRGMWRAPRQTFQILTKRPDVARARIQAWLDHDMLSALPPNIWIGASVENQEMANQRIPELLKIPASVRFLSLEPLLGPVEFSDVTKRVDAISHLGKKALYGIHWIIIGGESGPDSRPCDVGWIRSLVRQGAAAGVATFVKQLGAKPVIRNDGDDQVWPGATIPFADDYEPSHQGEIAPLKLRDKKGGDMAEWPVDLRHQEFPKL